jgi:GTP cyclohydrolase I
MPRGSTHSDRFLSSASKPVLEPSRFDAPRIERAVRELLFAIGEDPDREGLVDTPGRVARSWAELFGGLREEPGVHLARTFEQDSEDLVTLRDIEFESFCEHHLLPVFGRAHVAYLPAHRRVVGLSKLARTVEVFARRPQLQERMTAQIADALMQHLQPQGALVAIEAEHMCMKMRGVRKEYPVMATTASRGVFAEDAALRLEALQILGVGRSEENGEPDTRRGAAARPSGLEVLRCAERF